MSYRVLRWLHRRGVSRRRVRGSWLHRVLGERILSRDLWTLRRDSVARGWLLGSLVAATPLLGIQLLMGLPLALLFRANVFVVIALIFTTNPVTAPFVYPFCFLVGCWVLGNPASDYHWDASPVWHSLGPLMVGCLVVGLVVGAAGWALIRLLWRDRRVSLATIG